MVSPTWQNFAATTTLIAPAIGVGGPSLRFALKTTPNGPRDTSRRSVSCVGLARLRMKSCSKVSGASGCSMSSLHRLKKVSLDLLSRASRAAEMAFVLETKNGR